MDRLDASCLDQHSNRRVVCQHRALIGCLGAARQQCKTIE